MGYLALRFDDATIGQYTVGFNYMKKYNLKGNIFPIVNRVGKDGYIDWDLLIEMQNNNWEIGSHSMTHTKNWIDEKKKIKYELKKSLSILTDKGFDITSFCFPFNRYNSDTIETALKYYKCCLVKYSSNIINDKKTIIPSISSKEGIDFLKKKIEIISRTKGFLVITFHKISDDLNLIDNKYNISINEFKNLIDFIYSFVQKKTIEIITIKDYLEIFK